MIRRVITMLSLDEAIEHCKEKAEELEKKARKKNDGTMSTRIKCKECANEHRQLAEWLRELELHREIHEVILQFLVDCDLDICCDDLMDDAEEQKICEENCDNKCLNCWVRWARLKAREGKR